MSNHGNSCTNTLSTRQSTIRTGCCCINDTNGTYQDVLIENVFFIKREFFINILHLVQKVLPPSIEVMEGKYNFFAFTSLYSSVSVTTSPSFQD